MKRVFVVLLAFMTVGGFWFYSAYSTEQRTYQMLYLDAPSHAEWPDEKRLLFQFIKYHGHYLEIVSDDLTAQLKLKPSDNIEIEFSIVRFRGKIHKIEVIRVGPATEWKSTWTYFLISGPEHPSPWKESAPVKIAVDLELLDE